MRVHGTTHERPIDRFERERHKLTDTTAQPSFRLQAKAARVVAEDYLVSFHTNRYSVPFTLIGKTVELERRGDVLVIHDHGPPVATHPVLTGRHQLATARAATVLHARPASESCLPSPCIFLTLADQASSSMSMQCGSAEFDGKAGSNPHCCDGVRSVNR